MELAPWSLIKHGIVGFAVEQREKGPQIHCFNDTTTPLPKNHNGWMASHHRRSFTPKQGLHVKLTMKGLQTYIQLTKQREY